MSATRNHGSTAPRASEHPPPSSRRSSRPKRHRRAKQPPPPSSGGRIVTVIEFLSPSNKVPGDGQELYLQKQRELKASRTNLVEIDLTRAGERVLAVPLHRVPPTHRTTYSGLRAARVQAEALRGVPCSPEGLAPGRSDPWAGSPGLEKKHSGSEYSQ